MELATKISSLNTLSSGLVEKPAHLYNLMIRLYVAKIMFFSGLAKLDNWDGTLLLFKYEYAVPFLPPLQAAWAGVITELTLPILLALGLLSRYTAFGLFIFNAIIIISYPDISQAGMKEHMLFGALLATVIFYGPGKLSLDALMERFSKK